MGEPVLRFDSVVTRLETTTVHEGVTFSVGRGEIVALIGASGTGKSVLVKEAIGLLRPASGAIELLGTDVCRAGSREMNALRRRFGMLFQDGALFSSLTVAENVAVPFHEHTDLPDALIAPICAVNAAPERPATTTATRIGESSRQMASPTPSTTKMPAPYCCACTPSR